MAGYWPLSPSVSVQKHAKELGQYPAILTEKVWSITAYRLHLLSYEPCQEAGRRKISLKTHSSCPHPRKSLVKGNRSRLKTRMLYWNTYNSKTRRRFSHRTRHTRRQGRLRRTKRRFGHPNIIKLAPFKQVRRRSVMANSFAFIFNLFWKAFWKVFWKVFCSHRLYSQHWLPYSFF